MSKKKATPKATDHGKAIGVLLADAAVTKESVTELSSRVASLERSVKLLSEQNAALTASVRFIESTTEPPRRRLLARLFGR